MPLQSYPSAQSDTGYHAFEDEEVTQHANAGAHDEDWVNAAANKEKTELPSIRTMPRKFILKVLLHVCAVCVFLTQSVAVKLSHQENTSCEIFSLVLGCVYFCIGVLMPCWSMVVGHSAPVACILTHREHYKEFKTDGSVRMLMLLSQLLCPVSNALALVAPCYVCFGLASAFTSDQQAVDILSACDERLKLWLFGSSFSGLVGMLVFSSGKSGAIVVDASIVAIKGFIDQMMQIRRFPVEEEESLDWDDLAWHHLLLDKALANVWALNCVGGLWLMRIVVLFAGGLALGAYSLGQQDNPLRHLLVVGWFLLGLSGIALLVQMAMITTLCQNKRAGSDSVIAVAHECILRTDPHRPRGSTIDSTASSTSVESRVSKTLEQGYLAYLTGSNMGVQMLGVAITYSFVFTIVCQMLVYMPIGLNIVGHLVYPNHETGLASTSPAMSAKLGPLLL